VNVVEEHAHRIYATLAHLVEDEASEGIDAKTEQNCARLSRPSVASLSAHQLSQEHALLRFDGQSGTGAVLSDLAGFLFVMGGKDYTVLDHPLVQARLHLPRDQFLHRPESLVVRSLYDCPEVPVGSLGVHCRVVVATHQASKKKSRVGVTREGIVSELFFTRLPQHGFTASDVVELYLHRGAYAPVLADEDAEQDPDRWCSQSSYGQPCWQIVALISSGTCVWNWVISFTLIRCARPPLLLPARLCTKTWPTSFLLPMDMGHQRWLCPGKLVASLVEILPSSQMERCVARQGNRW
jgi:hypothetical protein